MIYEYYLYFNTICITYYIRIDLSLFTDWLKACHMIKNNPTKQNTIYGSLNSKGLFMDSVPISTSDGAI